MSWLTRDCKYILDYGENQGRHYVWADEYPRTNPYRSHSRIGEFGCRDHALQLIVAVLLGHAVLRVRGSFGYDLVPLVAPGIGRAPRWEPTTHPQGGVRAKTHME